jgi:hypothetical protein
MTYRINTTNYKTPYIPFKYYKDYEPVIKDTLEESIIHIVENIYMNILTGNTHETTKRKYIGILRNNLGVREMTRLIFYRYNLGFENLEYPDLTLIKMRLYRLCPLP